MVTVHNSMLLKPGDFICRMKKSIAPNKEVIVNVQKYVISSCGTEVHVLDSQTFLCERMLMYITYEYEVLRLMEKQ